MRRFVVTLVVLVVMSPTVAMAAEWYRCTMDGQARAACCCPGQDEAQEDVPPDAPNARSACCCDIEASSTPASEPRMNTGVADAALGILVVPRVVIEVQSPRSEVRLRPAPAVARPSSRAPPLFLSNCALLI